MIKAQEIQVTCLVNMCSLVLVVPITKKKKKIQNLILNNRYYTTLSAVRGIRSYILKAIKSKDTNYLIHISEL